MTEHLPECPILKPCCDDEQFPEHGYCGNYVGRCLHCMAECICEQLRACEARVREDERSSNFTPDDHADGMTESIIGGSMTPGRSPRRKPSKASSTRTATANHARHDRPLVWIPKPRRDR
jgi:hypothetical protein